VQRVLDRFAQPALRSSEHGLQCIEVRTKLTQIVYLQTPLVLGETTMATTETNPLATQLTTNLSEAPENRSNASLITDEIAANINAEVSQKISTIVKKALGGLRNLDPVLTRDDIVDLTNVFVKDIGHAPGVITNNLNENGFANATTQLAAIQSTGDYRIDALLKGSKWNQSTISFGFATEISTEIRNNVRTIFDTLSRLINLDFVESTGAGDIHYSFDDDADYAYARSPKDGGDVFLNPGFDHDGENGFRGGMGTHGFLSLIHETLHALGLKHPGNYDGEDTGTPPFLPYAEDNFDNTVMTYNFIGAKPATPMPYDILALQYLYGAKAYNEGNTTYVFDQPSGFSDGTHYWGMAKESTKISLVDTEGIDTLDFSKLSFPGSSGYRFDLNPGGILSARSDFKIRPYQAKDQSLPGGETTETYRATDSSTAIAYGVTIENVIGSKYNDAIIGNHVNNDLQGKGGYDTINGGLGDDTISGGSGQDVLRSRVVFGSPIVGLAGQFTPQGGGWTSFDKYPRQVADVNGDGRADIVGFGQDTVYVSFGQANGTFSAPIVGLSGEFTPLGGGWTSFNQYPRQLADINGDGRADIVGFGQDTVYVSLGQANGTFSSFITGFSGDFTALAGGWTSFNQFPRQVADINADGRADIVGFGQDSVYVALAGQDGNDSLDGGIGNDTLDGGTGNNTLNGGLDYDVVFYDRKYTDYQVKFTNNGDLQAVGIDGTDLLRGIEQINFSNGLYKVYTGDTGNNTLSADPNVWSMMFGGNGNDSLKGGNGNDSLVGGLGNDTLMGLLGNDVLDGGEDNDTLDGGEGNDTLVGGTGDDYLMGRLGADQMLGGIGNDKYVVDHASDVVSEHVSEGTDTVISSIDYTLAANVENLTLTDIAVSGTGNGLKNYILGNAVGNYIFAEDGDDLVNGRGGDDYIHGGVGNDTLYGDADQDYLYGATGDDLFYGGDGNDTLLGDAGNDFFYGQAGDDILLGGNGNDTLYGGVGADKFRFDLPSDGIDIIKDFNSSEGDRIEIFNLSFGATSLSQFSYNSNTGALSFDASPLDNVGPLQLATLANKPVGFSIQSSLFLV
jgi:Ca2+-binding RTX toxin-like protein